MFKRFINKIHTQAKEFIRFNKKAIIERCYLMSGVPFGMFTIYLLFFFKEIPVKWIFIIYTLVLIGMPVFTFFLLFDSWYRRRVYINRICKISPFGELDKIGFVKKTITKNVQMMEDNIMFAEINGCAILFDVEHRKGKIAEFTIYETIPPVGWRESSRQIKALKRKNIECSFWGLTRQIDTRKEAFNSIEELEEALVEFTEVVKGMNYTPLMVIEEELR